MVAAMVAHGLERTSGGAHTLRCWRWTMNTSGIYAVAITMALAGSAVSDTFIVDPDDNVPATAPTPVNGEAPAGLRGGLAQWVPRAHLCRMHGSMHWLEATRQAAVPVRPPPSAPSSIIGRMP